MESVNLAQFLALQDQLLALVKAGVSINLGLAPNGLEATALEKIGTLVARRMGEGLSLTEALDDRAVPPAYRSLVQLALQGGDLPAALAASHRTAEALDQSRHAIRHSLFYPLLVCSLVYVGVLLMCWFLVPALEGTYRGLNVPPDSGLRVLQVIRNTLPYWIAVPPLLLLLAAIWSRFGASSGSGSLTWVPGMSGLISEHRSTNFAESLASLLESGSPLPEGLRLAAAAWSDESLERDTLTLATAFERGQSAEDSPPALRMPPFLRWAIWHGDDTIGRTRALRLAAGTYREAAERRVNRLQVTAPIVACVLLGGGVTLLYALALFVPLAQLIRGLAA